MDKKFADNMIAQFQKKFFGFALSKCNDMTEAEELAARITCEAYITLRTVENVYNWEGYLHKIAANVYARYVQEQVKHKSGNIAEVDVQSEENFESDFIKKEELELLKREVAWLSKRHREIVLLHYFHNKKLAEIAEILDLPEGTVKWHLSDAKKILKEGLKRMRTEGTLGLEPIELIHMGNVGSPGPKGDTSNFLNSKLRQNIAYAAYFEPKTIEEIAKELNVGPVFVEDEVAYLEEWGFLDLMPGQKYRTNVFIDCVPYEAVLQLQKLELEVAKMICDEYVPSVIALAKNYAKERVYIPGEDFNYFLWSLIPMAVTQFPLEEFDWSGLKKNNYLVKRKDGGEYAASACLYEEKVNEIIEKDYICGPMYRGETKTPIFAWELSSGFDTRESGWEDCDTKDYTSFSLYLKGEFPKTEALLDKHIRLYERGLLRQEDECVNVIVVKETGKDNLLAQLKQYGDDALGKVDFAGGLKSFIPEISETVLKRIDEICEERIQLERHYFPKHMHKALEIYRKVRKVNVIMVIEELLNRGILKPLSDDQKKGVMIVVYSDVLPGEN